MHTFDYALVDFFYIDKMLNIGGVVIFDDLSYPSIRKLCRYALRTLPYSAIGPEAQKSTSKKGRFIQRLTNLKPISNMVRDEIAIPDYGIGLPSNHFVALRKNSEDAIGDGSNFCRRWDTHHRF
jgi:hypothetical protein